MSIKPVLVPDHTANDLRRLMDHFAEAATGPTKQQLTESRAAVAAAKQAIAESTEDKVTVDGQAIGHISRDDEGDPLGVVYDRDQRPFEIYGYNDVNQLKREMLRVYQSRVASKGVAEGWFSKSADKSPLDDRNVKQLMQQDHEKNPNMDAWSWQIGWVYADGNNDVKKAFSDAYHNGSAPFPPEERSFTLGFNARKKQGMAEGSLNEFASGNEDDGLPSAEYEVYQCSPEDQFEWISGPLLQTDRLDQAHGFAYKLHARHPDKAFMIWQERTQGSRGGYGYGDDRDVSEGISDVTKGIKRKMAGKPSKDELAQKHFDKAKSHLDRKSSSIFPGRLPGHQDFVDSHNEMIRGNKVAALPKKAPSTYDWRQKYTESDEQGVSEGSAGWMLRQDPELAKKVRANTQGYKDLKKMAGKPVPTKDEKGVSEAGPDVMRHKGDKTIRVVKKGGKPIGEIGIDAEASEGNGQYYVKLYDGSYDAVGFDTAEEALEELKYAVKSSMSEGTSNADEDPNLAKAYQMGNEAYKAYKNDPARAQAAQDKIEAEFPQYLKMWTTGYRDGERFDKSPVAESIDPIEQLRADIKRFAR